ncbi:MAG TPA: transglycosylase SLT domain-containing protein [Azospirillaceae bacterium]|nr:transglycosylase SLT domain-containing protein [Azospirillaceae bacterium]
MASGSLIAGELDAENRELTVRADHGDVVAAYELAIRYETAFGARRDLPKALMLYCQAAGEGHAEAAFRLGWMHLFGRGVDIDEPMAAAWFRLAAGRGYAQAIDMLRLIGPADGPSEPRCPLADNPSVDAPRHIVRLVDKLAPRYGLDPALVLSVMAVESSFRPHAVSPRKARGLMQLSPDTARRFGVARPLDPADNIRGGMRYLQYLLAYFEGNVTLVLAAYNAGEGAVDRFGGVPPYRETRAYVKKVRALYAKTRHPFQSEMAARSSPLVTQTEEVAELD